MEKKFTVVGTAINADGTMKVRWANDLIARIKILNKAGCTEIDLRETPSEMTKLEAVQWLSEQENLNEAQQEVIALKVGEKAKQRKRSEAKVTISGKVDEAVATGKETDPKVAAFIEKTLTEA
jgi:hypothetical protein